VAWDQPFFDPIEFARRAQVVTLQDAAPVHHRTPKVEHDAEPWKAAMEALLLVAEHGGPTMMARIRVLRALNVTSSAGLIHRAKIRIGESGN